MSSAVSDVTKLKFSELQLCGRSKELDLLGDVYNKVREPTPDALSSHIVSIRGYSGTGKSALVHEFMKQRERSTSDVGRTDTSCFICGKFDQLRAAGPYSALVVAFTELCDLILASDERDEVSSAIKAALGSEAKVLTNLVPKLVEITGKPSEMGDTIGKEEALNRLKFVFRVFVRTVCTPLRPVTLFIDDLQWADAASLDLIKAIVSDAKLKHFLFIGAFRENEVDEGHPLSIQLRDIKKSKNIVEVHLGNLGVQTTNELISSLTKLDPEKTQPLANVLQRKTHGNVFFVLQMLKMLEEKDFLFFSMETFQWTWDIDAIESETELSQNVVELVATKIKWLSKECQALLEVASCLWSTIDADMLGKIITELDVEIVPTNAVIHKKEITRLLDEAVAHLLVDKKEVARYQFAHDRIQQAAYCLIPAGRPRDLLHFRIGEIILQTTSALQTQEWLLFTVADQLGRGSSYITDGNKRTKLARLNLEAAEMATTLSAFVPAAKYLKSGIELLGDEDKWGEQYDLSLKLHNAAAEIAVCNGDFLLHKEIIDEVLENARCLPDKLRVYMTHVDSLGAQEKLEEAMNIGYSVLAELGEKIPRRVNSLHLLMALMKTKWMLRGRTRDELLGLPRMEDTNKIAAMKLLESLTHHAYFLQRPKQFALLNMRMVELTLRYGVDKLSPAVFACYGTILCSLSKWKDGYEFGRLAQKLLDRLDTKEFEAQLLVITTTFLNHWQEPFQNSLDPLLNGRQVGMESGDVEYAILCDTAYCFNYLVAGLRLPPLEEDMKAFCGLALEYGQAATHNLHLPLWQAVLNLMGRSDDPLQLTGEAMNQEEFLKNQCDNVAAIQTVWFMRAQLAYYFGNNELASEQLQLFRKSYDFKSHLLFCVSTYLYGLISLEFVRKTRKRKHKARAQKVIRTIKRWAGSGGVNFVHWYLLLEAELAALSRNLGDVKRLYDGAISAAARAGFLQDGALANERAGICFLHRGDNYWASHYLSRAYELYNDWGAQAKTEQLDRQYGREFTTSGGTDSSSGLKSSGLKARSKFSPHFSLMDKTIPGVLIEGGGEEARSGYFRRLSMYGWSVRGRMG